MAFDYIKYVRNNRLLKENFGGYVDLQPINNPLREEEELQEYVDDEGNYVISRPDYADYFTFGGYESDEEAKSEFFKRLHAYLEKNPDYQLDVDDFRGDKKMYDEFLEYLKNPKIKDDIEEATMGDPETLVFDKVSAELDALKNKVAELIDTASQTGKFQWSEALERLYDSLNKWETAFISADRKLGDIK